MSTTHWKDNLTLKITNILAFFIASGSSLSTIISPGKNYHYGGSRESYIHPAACAFSIWGLIHFLLLGLIFLQFTDEAYDTVVGISWSFPLALVLNGLFVNLFANDHYILAFITSIFVASVVSQIYYKLKSQFKSQNKISLFFIHLPFSLWHAMSVVLVVVSLFSAFGREKLDGHHHHTINNNNNNNDIISILGKKPKIPTPAPLPKPKPSPHDPSPTKPGFWTVTSVLIGIIFLTSTAWAYAFGDDGRGDIAGSAVITWFLYGIYLEQKSTKPIWIGALVGFVISSIAIIKSLYTTFGRRNSGISLPGDAERQPLVG